MGNGQPVSWIYVGMRCGWPQPITTTSVGIERAARDSGVMEDAKVRRYSWQFCEWLSVSLVARKWGGGGMHTPQKKCRINITRTRRGPFSLSAYKLLKVYFFLFWSSTGKSATFSRSPLVGGLLVTLISALKSAGGSLTAILLREEEGSLPIVSIQRTRGTRVRVRSKATMVGSERKKEEEETKELNKEVHDEAVAGAAAADPPETKLSIVEVRSSSGINIIKSSKWLKVVSLEISITLGTIFGTIAIP